MDHHPSWSEWEVKLARMRGLLDRFSLDGLLLRQNANFSWAACGVEAHINIADPLAAASLLVTRSERLLLANNIEGERLMQEAGLAAQGWDLRVPPGTWARTRSLNGKGASWARIPRSPARATWARRWPRCVPS